MLAPGLSVTNMAPVQYVAEQFANDLATVAGSSASPPTRISVASFCPDYPAAEIYAGPAARFAKISDQRWFLAALFGYQLLAQASHSVGAEPIRPYPPVLLVGLLSSYWSIVHPGFLLLVLALYDEAAGDQRAADGIAAIAAFQVGSYCPSNVRRAVVTTMGAAVQEERMPSSLAPFVPGGESYRYQPDRQAVSRWTAKTQEQLRAVAV